MAQAAERAAISPEELQLATRNHGMPLEALRHDVTPVGLHYLLIHFDVPVVDATTWRLEVGGLVDTPLSLSLDDLRARPRVDLTSTMECAGNGRALLDPRPSTSQPWVREAVGNATWTGVSVRALLADSGVRDGAIEAVFTGLDRGVDGGVLQDYERAQRLDEPAFEDAVLAYEMNGQPLPPQHGFPLRLVVPGWYGMTNVKWLHRIQLVDAPFDGYQQAQAYRLRRNEDDPGTPVDRMLPRALLAPPGVPEFFTRERLVEPGHVTLEGRAWSGYGPVARVEVSTDDGATWFDAELEDEQAKWAWRRWRAEWDARPGQYSLCCRATDAEGRVQPLEPTWNTGGYANNAVHRVAVTVGTLPE